MQAFQDQKEINENRFSDIDRRWTRVEEALRVQNKERKQDLDDIHGQLKYHGKTSSHLENRKINMTHNKLTDLETSANDCKENFGQLFEQQANFRMKHLDEKNDFIQNYTQDGNAFNKSLQTYMTNRMGDLGRKMEFIDAVKRQKTQQTLKELKEETIGEAKMMFKQEKERHLENLGKFNEDSTKELDNIKNLLKASQKQRQESESKLKLMIQGLVEQLSRLCDSEEKEGETTYDSLLKTLEECCDRIQQAQLR